MKPNRIPKVMTDRHWSMVEDYCDGIGMRAIEDKYRCHSGTVTEISKALGVIPRPIGFASYTIAHKWVTQARLDFERIKNDRN